MNGRNALLQKKIVLRRLSPPEKNLHEDRKMAESQIDMTPECLLGWRVFRKPGNVTEVGVPAASNENTEH